MLLMQRTNAVVLGVDPMQRQVCAEKDCQQAAPVGSMEVWSVFKQSEEVWKHFAFCGREHVLVCLPAGAMGRA